MDELDKTPEDPDIELIPVKLSKAYDPPEAEETFEALERLLQEETAAPELLLVLKKEEEKEAKPGLVYQLQLFLSMWMIINKII